MSRVRIWQSQENVATAVAADGWIPVCDIILDAVNNVISTPSMPATTGRMAFASNPDMIEVVVQQVDSQALSSLTRFPDYTVFRVAHGYSGVPAANPSALPFNDLALYATFAVLNPDLYDADTWLVRPRFGSSLGAVSGLRGASDSRCFPVSGRVSRLAFLPSNVPQNTINYNIEVWVLSGACR